MTITANKPAVRFAGKGKAARESAFLQVATLSFQEDTSRAASIANMRIVLGNAPSPDVVEAGKVEWKIGRIASRLPVSELPKGKTSPADRLEHARKVLCHMGLPVEPGKKAGKLKPHQTAGRRSVIQQRIVRAADEACSLFFAELGLSNARTLKEKGQRAASKAKRNPAPASGMGKATSAAPSHSELVAKPAKATTADDVITFLTAQSRMLQDYVNKNAKVAPVDAATAVQAFRGDILKAANALQERKAIAKAAPKLAAVK